MKASRVVAALCMAIVIGHLPGIIGDASAVPALCNGLLPGRPHPDVAACSIGHGGAGGPIAKPGKHHHHHHHH